MLGIMRLMPPVHAVLQGIDAGSHTAAWRVVCYSLQAPHACWCRGHVPRASTFRCIVGGGGVPLLVRECRATGWVACWVWCLLACMRAPCLSSRAFICPKLRTFGGISICNWADQWWLPPCLVVAQHLMVHPTPSCTACWSAGAREMLLHAPAMDAA